VNCYDCDPEAEVAVAVCVLCGKGLCRRHTIRQDRAIYEHVHSGMAAQVRVRERRVPRMVCAECDAAVGTGDAGGSVDVR
jgi:hypothetical protein